MTDSFVLPSIAPLAATSDVWFVDIWGVIHNGVRPCASSVTACEAFRKQGGTVLLVTNAPRPRVSVRRQLDRIGVAATAYDEIVSSGDVSRELIEAWAGRRILHIGPERDLPIFAGLGAVPGATANDAEVAVCTGLYDDETETPADYAAMLATLKSRAVPMICANPDRTVERDGRIIYCAGAVAAAYEALGGTVSYAGKPFQPIYELALGACRHFAKRAGREGARARDRRRHRDRYCRCSEFRRTRRFHRERRARAPGRVDGRRCSPDYSARRVRRSRSPS